MFKQDRPPLDAWREPADATDTGILAGIAHAWNTTPRQRAYLECVAWRVATLLDQQLGSQAHRNGLRRFFDPPK